MSIPEKAPDTTQSARAAEAAVITETPARAPEAPAPAEEPPAKAGKAEKAAPAEETEATEKAEQAVPAEKAEAKPAAKAPKKAADKGTALEPPTDRKSLDALVAEHGIDAAAEALSKVRVVDLRALAREYNGEFGIAGREIRNANKKVLIEEFRSFFSK